MYTWPSKLSFYGIARACITVLPPLSRSLGALDLHLVGMTSAVVQHWDDGAAPPRLTLVS